MFKYIEKLQKKPEHHKKSIAFGVSAVTTLLIFSIWVSVFISNLSGQETVAKDDSQPVSPVQNLRATAISGLENIKQKFDDLKGNIKSIISDEYERSATSSSAFMTDTFDDSATPDDLSDKQNITEEQKTENTTTSTSTQNNNVGGY